MALFSFLTLSRTVLILPCIVAVGLFWLCLSLSPLPLLLWQNDLMSCVGWRLLGSTQICLLQVTSWISLQGLCVPLLPTKRAIWKSNVSDFITCMYLNLVLVLSFLSLKEYSWVWLWKAARCAASLTLSTYVLLLLVTSKHFPYCCP